VTEDRVERLVRAAVRGIMEAVLSSCPTDEVSQKETPKRRRSKERPQPVAEMAFPSVSAMEHNLFDIPPESETDIEMAISALQRAREIEEAAARPHVQPGPGESEVTEWARIPQ
jgi:hypothetical protein